MEENPTGLLNVYTSNHLCCIKIRAEPLPTAATNLLEKSTDILRALSEQQTENIVDALERLRIEDSVSKNIRMAIDTFRSQLQEALGNSIDVSQIWAFGPRKCGPNILLNKIPSKYLLSVYYEIISMSTMYKQYFISDYTRSVWNPKDNVNDLTKYENSFMNGFQIATLAGPLCEEPMTGVCFVVEDWTVDVSQQISW